ncbi:outer membrane beta-barrel protein [Echinicola vietnamensis]|uniref:Lipid A 3-O-deacylase (PagL) n=1 Tax=Echinicola vietnamensis (strain DSM 17526 / LMG 23754 / KMM 6221) TaxID=926556 RepID=L0G4I8_ECHVK|nr:outer membrane beta-barrel protein [Echinicola vietnamensis]AGA79926.1 Lipid A 3-O-deacylase (PagL) [Echinicola vietnamensis DSM 17526]
MKYLICIGLLVSSLLCHGQTREKGDIEFIPIIGYSASYQLQSLLFGSSSVSGIQLGTYGNYFFNNQWSLRAGLSYQKMGTNTIDALIFANEYSERTTYITVPLTVNYHFGTKRNWFVNYGVGIGFLTNAEADYNDGNGFVDINRLANSTQFGLNGGIGYKFNVSPKFLMLIENSNLLGLTDATNQRSGKHFYMSFNLGAVFKI